MRDKGHYKTLKDVMYQKDVDYHYIAKKLDMGYSTVKARFSKPPVAENSSVWTLSEMYAICDLLNWDYDRLHELFPPASVRKDNVKQLRAM